MVGLIISYAMTLFGLIFADVHDFTEMAVLLTVVGVVITLIHDVRADYRLPGYGITLGIHALIWIVSRVSPELFGQILGLIVFIPVGIFLAVLLFTYILSGRSDSSSMPQEKERTPYEEYEAAHDPANLPDIVYDDANNMWRKTWCDSINKEAEYCNNDGQTVHIYHSNISGNGAETSAGWLHW